MPDSQRLVIEMLRWAVACGGAALNYCEATGLLASAGRVTGIRVIDRVTRADIELRAPRVVNCAGPWCEDVARALDAPAADLFRPSLAFNLLLDRTVPTGFALGVTVAGEQGGTYFLHPWKGLTLAGTHHAPWSGGAGVAEEQIALVLAQLNRALPDYAVGRGEVLRIHWGLLPARRAGTRELAVRERIVDHGASGGPAGLYSVAGVKFTTARRVAEKTLALALAREGRTLAPHGPTPRPAADPPPAAEAFEALLDAAPDAAREEVQRRVAREAVVGLDDLLLRRTDWGADPRRGARIGERVARLVDWHDVRGGAGVACGPCAPGEEAPCE
jgi:glycerol-3-phosphate dehydrogenase